MEKRKVSREPLAFDVDGVVDQLGGGVSSELVRLEIKRGNLKSTRLGRRILVTRAELMRYLDQNTDSKQAE